MSPSGLEKMPRMLTAWKAEAPVQGLAVARQARTALLRTGGRVLEHWSDTGERIARWRCPEGVVAADVSDDGSTVVVATERNVLYWCNAQLEPAVCIDAPNGLVNVAIDGDGWYAMATASTGDLVIVERNGHIVPGRPAPQPPHYVEAGLETPCWYAASRWGRVGL
ncbi:MAG: hypothetical protein R3C10_16145 [Pirellulales bacterium]